LKQIMLHCLKCSMRKKKHDFNMIISEVIWQSARKKYSANFIATPHIFISPKVLNAGCLINLWKPTGYVMHQQVNIQQFYVLPTLCIYVFCILSENKQWLVPLTP